jgi:RHS repeat-associated protein
MFQTTSARVLLLLAAGTTAGGWVGCSSQDKAERPREAVATTQQALNPSACDPNAPFDPPQPAFTGHRIANGLAFSSDGRKAYVSAKTTHSGTYAINFTQRDTTALPFAPLAPVTILNTGYEDRSPWLSSDGLTLYLTTYSAATSWQRRIAVATRDSATAEFNAPQLLPSAINPPGSHNQDAYFLSGQLYFASEFGGNSRNLYASPFSGTYGSAVDLGAVNAPDVDDQHPVLSPDGKTLYFASTRAGIGGDTNGDIWVSRRLETSDPFGSVTNLYGLNTSYDDFPVAIADNGCTLYFASTKESGHGATNTRLYRATRGASTPALVTTTLKIIGSGSVSTAPFQCSSTCSAQGAPDTTVMVEASGSAHWSGSCATQGGNPGSDAMVVFTKGGVCTVDFRSPGAGTPGSLCFADRNCASGTYCVFGKCSTGADTACDPDAPFGPISQVFAGDLTADGFTLSADEKTAYVSRKASTDYDIYVTTRNSTSEPFVALSPVDPVNSPFDDRAPWISDDGLRLYFWTKNTGWPGSGNLMMSSRNTIAEAFGAPEEVEDVNSSASDEDPFLLRDEKTLFFTSDRPTGDRDLWIATRSALTEPFSLTNTVKIPETAGGVNTPNEFEEERRPILTPDGLTLYFHSDREGWNADHNGDIFIAKRTSLTAAFGTPSLVDGLNYSGREFPVTLSRDSCTLYFASNRDTGAGGSMDFRLYRASRCVPLCDGVAGGEYDGCGGTCPYDGEAGDPCTSNAQCRAGLACGSGTCGGEGAVCGECDEGLECTEGTCQCEPCGPGSCGTTNACGETCTCGPGESGCDEDSDCEDDLLCTNGTCGPPGCSISPLVFGCGFLGAPCGPCTKNPFCTSDGDCPSGLVCPQGNGWRYGQPNKRVCEDPECATDAATLGCGEVTDTCGLCPRCIPDCEDKQCGDADPSNGCGEICTGLCITGDTCQIDVDCARGDLCMLVEPSCQGVACARVCRPADPCAQPNVAPPFCGTPGAACGPTCPIHTFGGSDCADRVCGTSPSGASCGTGSCGANQFCTRGGHCASLATDLPIEVPISSLPDAPTRPVVPDPSPPAVMIGGTSGAFAVTDRGSSSYAIPIVVPPGRGGIEPSLSLRYTSSSANGALGLGWSLDGLSLIAVCGETYAMDRFASPTGEFCLDGQRLVPVPGEPGEYRTAIDTFAKILAQFDSSESSVTGFKVFSRDGRILTYGGLGTSAVVPNTLPISAFGLRLIEDRSGNFLRVTYRQIPSTDSLTNLVAELVPDSITYTGHGSLDGDREVIFNYDQNGRTDFLTGWRAGGFPMQRSQLMTSIEVRAQNQLVRSYELGYTLSQRQNHLTSIRERLSEVACDQLMSLCKPATTFEYYEDVGFHAGVDLPATLGENHPLPPIGIVHRWRPEDGWGVRTPQLGRLSQEERRGDRITSFYGGASETSLIPSPIPGWTAYGVRLGLAVSGAALDNFWFTMAAQVVGEYGQQIIEIFFPPDVETEQMPWLSFTSSPLFRDPQLSRNSVTEYIPDQAIVVGPTGGEQLRNVPGLFAPQNWFFDIDGDGVDDKLYCYSGEEPVLDYKFANAASVDTDQYPTPPFQATHADRSHFAPTAFDSMCRCAPLFGDAKYCPQVPSAVFDVDGDGTPNLVVLDQDTGRWSVLIFSRDSLPRWDTELLEPLNKVVAFSTHAILPIDVNGDGLRDIVALGSEKIDYNVTTCLFGCNHTRPSYIAMNTGTGFGLRSINVEALGAGSVPLAPEWGFYVVDLDRDGKEEILQMTAPPPNDPNAAVEWKLRRFDDLVPTLEEVPGGLLAPYGTLGDFDGDGNLDLITVNSDKNKQTFFAGKGRLNGLLQVVTDGLGHRIEVSYNDKEAGQLVFDSGLQSFNPGEVSDSTCRWPYRCSERVDNVLVSSHTEKHDIDQEQLRTDRVVEYRYKGSREDVAGYGWLGFWERTIVVKDQVGSPLSISTIKYEPPPPWQLREVPIPYYHVTTSLVREVITEFPVSDSPATNVPEHLETSVVNSWQPRSSSKDRPFPLLVSRTETVKGIQTSIGSNTETLYQRVTSQITDEYGNIENVHIVGLDVRDDAFEGDTLLDITRTFAPTPEQISEWLISLPQNETVFGRPRCSGDECTAGARQRFTEFFYYDHTPLLHITTRDSNHPLTGLDTELLREDGFGNVTGVISSVVQGDAREIAIGYDSRNLFPSTITRVAGGVEPQTTQLRFDDRTGAITARADPNGIDETWSYDELGVERKHYGPAGVRTTTYGAGVRRELSDVIPGGLLIDSAYSVTVTGIGGPEALVEEEFNSFGQPVRRGHKGLNGKMVYEEYAYDPRQRLTVVTRPHLSGDASQSFQSYSYDELDRIVGEFYPNGQNVTHDYALVRFAGSMPAWQEASGAIFASMTTAITGTSDPSVQTVRLSNRDGQLVRAIDGLSQHTDYKYGAFGQVTRVTDPAERSIDVNHDAWGRATSVTDLARGGTQTVDHNGLGEAVFTRDAGNRTRNYIYDDFGRLSQVIDHTVDGDLTSQWIYDGDHTRPNEIGRLIETVSPTLQRTTYGYEAVSPDRNRGLLTNVTRHFVAPGDGSPALELATDYQYDDFANITRVDYPSAFGSRPAVIQYFDDFGNLTQVQDAANPSFCYWRVVPDDQDYRIRQARLGAACDDNAGGHVTGYVYSALSGTLLATATNDSNGTTIQSIGYGYDLLGRVTSRVVNGTSESYSYDALSRLTNVNGGDQDYTYDPDGRGRLDSLRTANGSTNIYDYHAAGRDWIHTAGPWEYWPDAVGNVASRTGPGVEQTFDYTPFDLPKRVTSNDAITDFEYDADQNRILKKSFQGSASPSVTTFYAGASHQQVEQQNGADFARSMIYAGGMPVAQLLTDSTGTTTTRYLLSDELGSVRTAILPDGTLDGPRDYTAFGEPRGANTGLAQNPYGFTGHEEDTELGIVNMRGRLYDPVLGQFLQADPIISEPSSQGLNRYAYVNNSPLNATDPTGFARSANCPGGFSWCGLGGLPSFGTAPPAGTIIDIAVYSVAAVVVGAAAYGVGTLVVGSLGPGGNPGAGRASDDSPRGTSGAVAVVRRGLELLEVAAAIVGTPTLTKQVISRTPASAANRSRKQPQQGPKGRGQALPNAVAPDTEWGRSVPIDEPPPKYGPVRNPLMEDEAMKGNPETAPFWDETLGIVGTGPFGPELKVAVLLSRAAAKLLAKGATTVYRSVTAAGKVQYVGITNNLARRAAEHLASKGIQIEKLMGGLSRSDARAVEQALIEIHGLGKNHGTLGNLINSIAQSNPAYAQQLQRGYELLQSIGY